MNAEQEQCWLQVLHAVQQQLNAFTALGSIAVAEEKPDVMQYQLVSRPKLHHLPKLIRPLKTKFTNTRSVA